MTPKFDIDYTQFLTEKRLSKLTEVVKKRQKDLTVVLENIIDPHNLSACLRSCDSVGIDKVYLVYDGTQPFPKLKESSSSSARKWVEVMKFRSIEECYETLRENNFKIYTTKLTDNSKSLYEINFIEPTALVFGNERDGVSDLAVELADGNFLIPQVGMIESLNISVACAVSLYEAFRQRLAAGSYNLPQFDNNEIFQRLNKWAER